MSRGRGLFALLCSCSLLVPPASAQEAQTSAERAQERHLAGHSRFGEAFDEGPRERPVKMTGIGATHFPITTSEDYKFLVSQLQRMNQKPAASRSTATSR